MKRLILVANWKDKPSLPQALILAKSLAKQSRLFKSGLTFIAPPWIHLGRISDYLKKSSSIASQDIHSSTGKPQTGAITSDLLKEWGVRLVIIGHSERRAQGEDNHRVSLKIKETIKSGMMALLCVGELERDAEGNHFEFLRQQLKQSLEGVRAKDLLGKVIIAYEPIWAIGKKSKDAIEPNNLAEIVLFIKKVLADMYNREIAEKTPVLYGGSVESANVSKLLSQTGIRGFLVGHASLDPKHLRDIAEQLFS